MRDPKTCRGETTSGGYCHLCETTREQRADGLLLEAISEQYANDVEAAQRNYGPDR
jgi:hypothetical protein